MFQLARLLRRIVFAALLDDLRILLRSWLEQFVVQFLVMGLAAVGNADHGHLVSLSDVNPTGTGAVGEIVWMGDDD